MDYIGNLNMTFKFISHTIKELLKNTTRKSIKHRKGCWPSKYRFMERKDVEGVFSQARWFFIVRCDSNTSDPRGHRVRISLDNPSDIPDNLSDSELLDQHVKVTCSCKAFLNYGARYNAQSKGYLDPHNNQKGKVVPPQADKRRNLICKHIAVALPFAVKFIRNFYRKSKGEKIPFI